jgi:uncharacterized membrane protein YbhN (UPF0104 family)
VPRTLASLSGISHAVSAFFSHLASVDFKYLFVATVFYIGNLVLRSRGAYNVLRAAYPAESFRWKEVGGAYFAAYGANAVIPARPGDVMRLFLLKRSVPNSRYPTLAASFLVENVFDTAIGLLMLAFAFTQGVFPKPPDFSKLGAFDLSYLAGHPRFTLFLLTLLAIGVLVGFAILSERVRLFWVRVRQGVAILRDRDRYLRQVAAFQFAGWLCRFVCFWSLLDAFGIGGSVQRVLLVFGVNAVASVVPLTPGGAGVQQALLATVFANVASSSTVAAYSVGQQIVIAGTSFVLGLVSLAVVFRLRSFKHVIRMGRADRAERAVPQPDGAGSGPPREKVPLR